MLWATYGELVDLPNKPTPKVCVSHQRCVRAASDLGLLHAQISINDGTVRDPQYAEGSEAARRWTELQKKPIHEWFGAVDFRDWDRIVHSPRCDAALRLSCEATSSPFLVAAPGVGRG